MIGGLTAKAWIRTKRSVRKKKSSPSLDEERNIDRRIVEEGRGKIR